MKAVTFQGGTIQITGAYEVQRVPSWGYNESKY